MIQAPGEQTRRLLLGGGTPGVVTRCRDFTRQALQDWGWPVPDPDGGDEDADLADRMEAAEDVLLMVSELVTNACMHAGGPRELVLRLGPERLRVEVSDGSPEHPRRRPAADPAVPGGHGLTVLDRLARRWGSAPSTSAWGGKTVWLEVAAPVSPALPRPWDRRDRPDRPDRPDRSGVRSAASPESG
ncbi:ATP-binding protein [Streptomyces bambusae]|uniref:ATP-binding protein n=1 Tax=Streptomyces bambusae TaxID=1550616 RepID=UPI00215551B6|nr:ATP-binding protein [Streptomyces bambusae]